MPSVNKLEEVRKDHGLPGSSVTTTYVGAFETNVLMYREGLQYLVLVREECRELALAYFGFSPSLAEFLVVARTNLWLDYSKADKYGLVLVDDSCRAASDDAEYGVLALKENLVREGVPFRAFDDFMGALMGLSVSFGPVCMRGVKVVVDSKVHTLDIDAEVGVAVVRACIESIGLGKLMVSSQLEALVVREKGVNEVVDAYAGEFGYVGIGRVGLRVDFGPAGGHYLQDHLRCSDLQGSGYCYTELFASEVMAEVVVMLGESPPLVDVLAAYACAYRSGLSRGGLLTLSGRRYHVMAGKTAQSQVLADLCREYEKGNGHYVVGAGESSPGVGRFDSVSLVVRECGLMEAQLEKEDIVLVVDRVEAQRVGDMFRARLPCVHVLDDGFRAKVDISGFSECPGVTGRELKRIFVVGDVVMGNRSRGFSVLQAEMLWQMVRMGIELTVLVPSGEGKVVYCEEVPLGKTWYDQVAGFLAGLKWVLALRKSRMVGQEEVDVEKLLMKFRET